MAKKKKKEIVATVGLDGKIIKNNDNKEKNVVANVGLDGTITRISSNNDKVSNNKTINNNLSKLREQESKIAANTVKDNINKQIAQNITQGVFQNDVRTKVTQPVSNKQIAPIKKNNQQQAEENYQDTGKKYGDYFYYDYANKKDNKIYKKGNDYYIFDDRTNSYTNVNQASNRLSNKKIEEEELAKAKKLGYKEQERKTTKEYQQANSAFKKLQKEYKLTDKELQNFIDNGTLSQKHVSIITNSMSATKQKALEYRDNIKSGKIKQYDDTVLSVSDRLDLDTKGLTKKQYNEFEQDLYRQQKAKDNQYRGARYGYDGTLSGTLKALVSTKERASDKINREIVAPINNLKENYEYGKRNNQLALEYYKKMKGEKNKVDKLEKETELYNYFNKDIATNPGWAGTAIQNANTQVESIKKQGLGATILGAAGAIIGTVIEPGAGTVAGTKTGASIGYTIGSTPYTYKLEAGNQYKSLLEMGVPDKIAKAHSKRVGAINAAIESGENVVDLLTFKLAGKSKAIPTESIKELVDDYGDKQVKSWLGKSLGDKVAESMVTAAKSYGQNIVSESIEEMSQEGTSIAGERLAAKESGIKRGKTLSEDINRVLEAGSSAAISTAFTAPISSLGGAIAHNTVTNLQSKIENKAISSKTINDTINQEIVNSNKNFTENEISDIQKETYQQLKDNGITITGNERYSTTKAPMVVQYQETDNQKLNNLRQSAVNEKMINNKKTQEAMNVIENIIADKDYNVSFDSTITNEQGKSVDGKISLNENGETDIKLNPNSDRAVEFLLTHEITHAIETKELRGLILDYAQKNNEFKTALQDLQKTYNTPDVSDEIIADISAQVLGNQEFINSLQQQNTQQSRGMIKTIYESIKRVLNKLTTKGRYKNFVQDLETKWRDAYRVATNETTKNNLSNESKYMMTSIQGMNNGVKTNDRYLDIKNRYDRANELSNNPKYSNEDIRQETGWFKDNKGNWEFEISDHKTKFIKNPKPNTTYKLSELFDAKTLYEMYPGLKDVDVKTQNMGDKKIGNFNRKKNEISLNNKKLNNLDDVRGTLLHEIQHYIQKEENLPNGTTILLGNKQYANSKGEIEAADTKNRMDLKPNQREKKAPESSKENPVHPNREAILNHKRNAVEKIAEKIYNIFGDGNNENFEEINYKNIKKTDEETNNTHSKYKNGRKELDNSSFSYRGSHQIENAKSITDLDLKDIENKIIDIDGYLTKQSESDLNKLKKILKSTNDKVKIYRASPVNELNSGDWVTTDKSYAQNVAQNNGGEVYSYEVNANELYYPDNIKDLPSLHRLSSFQYIENPNNTETYNDIRYSQKAPTWQEHLEKNYKSTGTKTYFDEMRDTTKKAIAPIHKEIKTLSNEIKELKQEINSNKQSDDLIKISKMNKEEASTTPKLPRIERNTPFADKESSFYGNVTEKSKFLSEESRKLISTDSDVQYYSGITNEQTMDQAYKSLQKEGKAATSKWFNKQSKDATAIDVAKGWILLKQYQDAEDYGSMVEVAKKMREIGTTSGQTVQAFNILSRLTPEGMVNYAQSELIEAYNQMVKNKTKNWIDKHRSDFELNSDEVQFIVDNMKEVQDMDDGYEKRVKLAEIQKLMTDKLPTEKGRKIKSWMRISMLFNPKTQVRNVMGNALIAPVNYFGDVFASIADRQISKKTGVRTTGNMNVKAILKGFKDGAYQSTNDYRKGINTRDMEGNRFEIGEGKSFSEKNLIGKGLNRVDGLLNYIMDAGDRVFSQASFENSLQNQMKLNHTNEITQDMIDIARAESLQRTWNDNNNYTKFVLDVRRGLNKIGTKGYGLGDILIPFAKTPANLTKAIVDYSPAGLIQSVNEGVKLKRSLSNGQYNAQMQHNFVQKLGKATAGTILYVLGYALAKAKITSGESDDDKDVSNFMKNTLGVNSYSIKIGDKSFTYDWAQPLAAPLSITANITNKKYQNKDMKELAETIIDSLDTGGSILLEQSFLQSINDVLKSNDGVVSGLVNELLELPARSIPTFSKQVADMVDGTQRQTYVKGEPVKTALNSAKVKIPGVSKQLSPTIDTMGRDVKKYGGKNNAFNVFLNPANVSTENVSKAAKEIYKVYQATDEKNIFPRVAPYSIDRLPLSTEQRAKYQKEGGEIVEKSVNELIKNDDYKKLSNKDKTVVINKIVSYASNKAKSKVLKTKMSKYWNSVNKYIADGGTVAEYYLYKVVDD